MTTSIGKDGVVKIAASGGSVAAVAELRNFTMNQSADTIEDSVMGDTVRSFKQGLQTTTVSLDVYWDETDTNGQQVIDPRAEVDFEVYPTGTASGETYYTGSGVVTSRSISAAFDGMVEASFEVQVSGAVTEATV